MRDNSYTTCLGSSFPLVYVYWMFYVHWKLYVQSSCCPLRALELN